MRRKRTSVRTVRVVVLEGRGKDECDAVEWCVESGTGKWTRRKMGQRPEGSAWWNTGIVEWTMEWTLIGSSHFPMPPRPLTTDLFGSKQSMLQIANFCSVLLLVATSQNLIDSFAIPLL
ncbi:Os03g0124150 [Oryza sativa Japonica Group]|uniref:Os03g0124150 protein n=1 Tax=Oryza sativa subsp. japonica TaxID=39947 RepID=C7J0J2_ORYSJ|nr:Os03g0124150 [Oryza sativa Japonica Group]|eukprot:NP_001173245.1 Os03g0124150 [Oryza sativa Japonica Group]